ncbi:MAG: hypothetical protein ACXAD7_13640 [Candidatus Kariarchaeaceae archaeon]|jgi:hypothetical protein
MKLGKIISRLMDDKQDQAFERFEEEIDKLSDVFFSPTKLEPITIGPILVLTDNKPHSLISIAYGIRLANAIQSPLIAIAGENFKKIIESEIERSQINFTNLNVSPTLEKVQKTVKSYKISFIVVPMYHELREKVVHQLHIPVLVTKIDFFSELKRV